MSSGWRLAVIAIAIGSHATLMIRARSHQLPLRLVLAAIVVVLAIGVLAPPRDSNDLWGYVSYARVLSEHGDNPYRVAPSDHPDDPMLERMSEQYRDTPTIYGPAFTAVSAFGTTLTGTSELANRLFFQLLSLGAAVGALVLVSRRTDRDPAALAFLGLSPLVAAIVNGAHTDLLLGGCLLVALAFVDERRHRWVGLALAAAVLIKVVALLPAAALLLWLWRAHGTRAFAHATSVLVPIVVGVYLAVGGAAALEPVREGRLFGSRGQAWELLRRSWSESLAAAGVRDAAELAHLEVARLATPVVAILAVVVVIRLTRDRDPTVPLVGAGLAYLLAAPYVLPWYSGWVLPAAGTSWRRVVAGVAQAQAALIFLIYSDPPGRLPPDGFIYEASTRWGPLLGILLASGLAAYAFLHHPSRAGRRWRLLPPAGRFTLPGRD